MALIRRRDDVIYRPLAEGGVLLDMRSGEYFSINATGVAMWELLPDSVAGIVAELRRRYPEAPPEIEHEVMGFLDALQQCGLVEEGGADDGSQDIRH